MGGGGRGGLVYHDQGIYWNTHKVMIIKIIKCGFFNFIFIFTTRGGCFRLIVVHSQYIIIINIAIAEQC